MDENTNKKGLSAFPIKEITAAVVSLAAIAAYCYWLINHKSIYPFSVGGYIDLSIGGVAASAVCIILFVLILVLAIPGAMAFFTGKSIVSPVELMGERSSKRSRLHPWLKIFISVLLAHIAVMAAAYVICLLAEGYRGTFFARLKDIWLKGDTDIQHYFDIAEHWYITDASSPIAEHKFIVFLPLYPLCLRAANHIFGSSFVSGMVLNTLFSSLSGVVIYELALCDLGRRSSRFAVFCAFALPAAVFYVAPMSEPLFLLLTAGALLAMRRKRFVIAGVLGGLAAFTRSLGIVLVVPFAAEAVRSWVERYKQNKALAASEEGCTQKKPLAGLIALTCIGGLLVLCGSFAYLLINKLVWNDWFKFMEFQNDHWHQNMSFFFNSAAYQTEIFIKCLLGGEIKSAFGLWLPNLLFVFGSLAVLFATARELRTSYVLYFAAYFAVSVGATWLLSAPRYLTACVVLPIALAKLCEARDDGVALYRSGIKKGIVGTALVCGQLVYLMFYVLRYPLY